MPNLPGSRLSTSNGITIAAAGIRLTKVSIAGVRVSCQLYLRSAKLVSRTVPYIAQETAPEVLPARPPSRVARWVPALCLAVMSVLYFVPTCIRAAREKLWYDEIHTFDAAALLPHFRTFWSFLTQAEGTPTAGIRSRCRLRERIRKDRVWGEASLRYRVLGNGVVFVRVPGAAAPMALCNLGHGADDLDRRRALFPRSAALRPHVGVCRHRVGRLASCGRGPKSESFSCSVGRCLGCSFVLPSDGCHSGAPLFGG